MAENNLNYSFNQTAFLIKTLSKMLPRVQDRMDVVRWLQKLSTCNQNIEEARLRNEFAELLLSNLQRRVLEPPFNDPPPVGLLLAHAHLLPTFQASQNLSNADWLEGPAQPSEDATCDPRKNAALFNLSPDKGSFLLTQPLPRCGVFCYMAVISKRDNNRRESEDMDNDEC